MRLAVGEPLVAPLALLELAREVLLCEPQALLALDGLRAPCLELALVDGPDARGLLLRRELRLAPQRIGLAARLVEEKATGPARSGELRVGEEAYDRPGSE